MKVELKESILALEPHSNLALGEAERGCVHVHWGHVWVTHEGDPKDHIVHEGESFAFGGSGKAVLSAMSPSGISVMERCATKAEDTPLNWRDATPPAFDYINRHVERARQLRARYIGDLFHRAWAAIRHTLSHLG